ncbi:type A chloramphenicol O-acetyltransferase [Photorhabdus luminescens]|uniref:Chloramphenicol acetyltransferase n=1 Tax=Photorhabdus luminescens subsp. sonorensis TaxID=1173677 RepID=A0A5C4REF3_PHOLU|nr:type A chloramphenicol O-acetyltransferase [Photorhabdus luminescens]TNH42336.1 type A chloramphenicol O-acetyltransferase [Photorhabdus luminescens subsp. sonorensis]
MNYSKIDIDRWDRKEHFLHYRNVVQCGFSLTTKIDITYLLSSLVEKQYKFYPTMIYLISKVVNSYSEFRMAIKDEELIVWDDVNPAYTIFHKETETFSAIWTEFNSDLPEFMKNYSADYETYKDDLCLFSKPELPENHFHISSVPWVNFDGFNLNVANFTDYFPPIFTMGKFHKSGNQTELPLAIQVHHATCDGFHVGRVIDKLQELCNGFI